MARLFLDMDGTLAKFHDEADYLERMFEKDFFSNLKPFENMVAGAKLFMQQHPDVEVFIISSCVDSPYCVADKNKWLDEHLNLPAERRLFPPMGASKADYIPGGVTKDDFLLDDYNRGLNQFMFDGGSAIKCHNNINQQGRGAYGGSAGNLWVGPMVHTEDKPEMIAAELAQHMGLAFNLDHVTQAYPEVDISFSPSKCNLLNEIRFLAGKEEFYDHALTTEDGKVMYLPGHQLRAISLNVFNDDNFTKHLCDPSGVFSRGVSEALQKAKLPLVGRIELLNDAGTVRESKNYYSKEQMESALESCRQEGTPFRETWYINKKKALGQIRDPKEAAGRLISEFELAPVFANQLSTAMTTSPDSRTHAQTELLVRFWQEHNIPETLQSFTGLTTAEIAVFSHEGPGQGSAPVVSKIKSGNSLADKIRNARQRSGSEIQSGSGKGRGMEGI